LSEIHRKVIPTTTKYITAAGKQALILLQSAATLIPVSLIQEAIGVAIKIIQICEVSKILAQVARWITIYFLSGNIYHREKGQRFEG
jgi:hypothetical protein